MSLLKKKIRLFFFILILLVSCKTDKTPLWLTEPPPDDELNIYIVASGKNSEIFDSLLNQLYSRFNIEPNSYFKELVYNYYIDENGTVITILDSYSTEAVDYELIRIKRTIFDPILELYKNRYTEMIEYISEDERLANIALEDGEIYTAYSLYMKALAEQLSKNDEFYTPSIIKLFDKILDIFALFNYAKLETFKDVVIGLPVVDKHLYFELANLEKYNFDGFIYNISFKEDPGKKSRKARIKVKSNSLEFIPPRPINSGSFTIKASIIGEGLEELIFTWKDHNYLGNRVKDFGLNMDKILEKLTISFDYTGNYNFSLFPKLISVANESVSLGISEILGKFDEDFYISGVSKSDFSNEAFIREVTIGLDKHYKYLFLCSDLTEDKVTYDEDGVLLNLKINISVVDIDSYKVLGEKNIESQYVTTENLTDLSYIDLGNKIGELIYTMKF